jgi:exodeoxyribonuclease V alpha subunit
MASAISSMRQSKAASPSARRGGIQPFGAAYMEEEIARWVANAASDAPHADLFAAAVDPERLGRIISAFEARQPYRLTERQRDAIRGSLSKRFMVLAGYAGSGKTTCLLGVCDVAEALGRELHLMALSGRAAKRISEATGRRARTVAGFLQRAAEGEKPRDSSIVIVDESSMLDLATLWRITRVLGSASLILVGDPAQLPPIGFGLTFHRFCNESHDLPRVILDRVMRQTAESGIPAVAEAVRYGQFPDLPTYEGRRAGVSFISCDARAAIKQIARVGRMLIADGVCREEIQILAPVRSGPAGVDAINLQFHRAKRQTRHDELFPGRDDIGPDDPIIWTVNDWQRELMNGSMGRVDGVLGGVAEVTLDGNPYQLSAVDAESIELAYAVSVHKAQGSEWPIVIVPIFKSRILDRTLIYTAITRASSQVILVGDEDALRRSIVEEPFVSMRQVGISNRLSAHLFSTSKAIADTEMQPTTA